MKTYVTFGQDHVHVIGNIIFDKNCVAVITHDDPEEGRIKAFELFGRKFCMEHSGEHWNFAEKAHYFPRGALDVPV